MLKLTWTGFILQRSLRIIAKVNPRASCKDISTEFNVLTVCAMYIFQVIMVVKQDTKYTNKNSDVHSLILQTKKIFEEWIRVTKQLKIELLLREQLF